jgi:hypothetical protein
LPSTTRTSAATPTLCLGSELAIVNHHVPLPEQRVNEVVTIPAHEQRAAERTTHIAVTGGDTREVLSSLGIPDGHVTDLLARGIAFEGPGAAPQ